MIQRQRILLCCLSVSLVSLAWPVARAETYVSDFADGFDGWSQQWQIDSPTGSPGVASHSMVRGYNDSASLHFDMGDGFGDDGTLWIEKQFPIPPDIPTQIALSFQLFNEFQSDFNNFEVKAAIRTDNPEVQGDFETIGTTGSAEGWVPFDYEQTITSRSGDVWVALGVRVAWEGHREYWIDQVVVTATPIPEPSSGLLALVGAGMLAARIRRRRARQASSIAFTSEWHGSAAAAAPGES